jgi:hypothetical protein
MTTIVKEQQNRDQDNRNQDTDSDVDTDEKSIDVEIVINTENFHKPKYSGFYDQKPSKNSTQDFISAYRGYAQTEKRLLCHSIANQQKCNYNDHCNYAHNLIEQAIDPERFYIYQIIFDKDQMKFYSLDNPKTDDIYKHLLTLTGICERCDEGKCTGGFNCRHGANIKNLKICKNDLLTGGCLNKVESIKLDPIISKKISGIKFVETGYKGCMNGHHLTDRGLIYYYKYIQEKENSKNTKYHSIRYIELDPLKRIYQQNYTEIEDSSSDEEELKDAFKKKII